MSKTGHDAENHIPEISVVVPIRDEEGTIRELHRRLREGLPPDTEIILVDDGSRDGTPGELARVLEEDPSTVALRLLRPFGKSQALAAGFARCRGRVIATIDADLQEDPLEIVRLASHVGRSCLDTLPQVRDAWPRCEVPGKTEDGDFDLVSGWRKKRRDSFLKVLLSRIFNALVRLVSGFPFRDINCGLKVMRREVVEEIPLEGGFHRFVPLLAHWKGFRVGEVEVPHAPRRHGKSRYGGERIVHALIDLLVLLFLNRYERRPGRLFFTGGATLFGAGFLICLFITSLWVRYGSIQSHYPLMTLGVLLLLVGVQLVSTGLLGEIVSRQHTSEPADKPETYEIPRRTKGAQSRPDSESAPVDAAPPQEAGKGEK